MNAVVLLSGGFDSVAALYWAKQNKAYSSVLACMFDYGQPNRDQELSIAGTIALELGVERICLVVADSLPRGAGILRSVEDDDGREDGVSPAFVPGRNLVFLTCAAAHAAVRFKNGPIALVIGANGTDARRFPDCHVGAFAKLAEALRHGVGREIVIASPWIDRTKEQVLSSLDDTGRALVARSWSCYRGKGPCGRCSACVLRAAAFQACGMADACKPTVMFGGDPR